MTEEGPPCRHHLLSSCAGSSAKDMHQAASPDEDADAEESAMSDLLTCLGMEEQKVQM